MDFGHPLSFDDLVGFDEDDLAAAFSCFHASASAVEADREALRPALPTDAALALATRAAVAYGPSVSQKTAKRFFTDHFCPHRVSAGTAFFTGYYEPVVDGSLTRTADHTAPLLGRPDDLRTFAASELKPARATDLAAARVRATGDLGPYPTRRDIEAAAMAGSLRPVAWLRDWVEVFLIQVQGSARIRLSDGTLLRARYAGRNGHPYTSIGKRLVESGAIAADAMSLARLKDWVRQAGQAPGQPGRSLMQENASYIFFEVEPAPAGLGPIGGAGVPLTRLRSIAVDRTLWCYGLPFWIDATLPWRDERPSRFARLMIAQDTGSAIIGPARADLFFGTGDEAGQRAGDIRHHGSFIVLRPIPQLGELA